MMMLTDGRSELWQWDTGRTLTVDADCSQVHFSNKVFGRSIDVDVVGGTAIIPDVLLQTDKDFTVWAFVGTAENGYTKISKTFKVNRRNKPADYVFTPVEQTNIAEIAAIAQSVRDDADNGLFDGAQGPAGPIGPVGPQGEQGLTGPKGDTGPQGEQGPQGLQGVQGEKGEKGDKGDKGDTGDIGPQGPQGAPGENGKDAVVDSTLTQSGQAADAKATGDAIGRINDDLANSKKSIAELNDKKITKFYANSLGEITLNDSDKGKIQDMFLYGKSEQKQYSGYNTIKPFDDDSGTESGVTWARKNGVLTMYGKCTTTGAVINIGVTTKDFDANKSKGIYEATGSFSKSVQYDFHATIASDKNTYAIVAGKNIRLYMYEGKDYTGTLAVALADVSVSQTSFEPYVGGIPSPNPDYPQEIKSVVNPVVKVTGKNLLNPSMFTDESSEGNFVHLKLKPNTSYTMSLKYGLTYGNSALVFFLSGNAKDGASSSTNGVFCDKSITQISDKNGYVTVAYRTIFNQKPSNFDWQLETGSVATEYEPYTEQTATLPYTLNAIPVDSGGNVTIDGQQYIADYVDIENKKLVRCVDGGRMYGSTNNWVWASRDSGTEYYAKSHPYIQVFKKIYNTLAISNSFSIGAIWGENSKNKIGVSNSDKPYVFIGASTFNSLDDLKTYLDNNEVYVYSILATQKIIDLTDEEVQAFKELATYYPTTNIFVTSEQLDGYTTFNYSLSMANGWNLIKEQLGDTIDYIYDMDLQSAEAYVNSEYAVALAELEV